LQTNILLRRSTYRYRNSKGVSPTKKRTIRNSNSINRKKLGFEWDGDWKSLKDKPHFEMMFGKTLAELRKLYAENGNDHTKIPL
jgi:hypothetical protein